MGRGGTDVIVIGAGISGLTTALTLQRRGRDVTVVTADLPSRTVSMVAAAVWFPTAVAAEDRVVDWARRSRAEFERLAEEEPSAGVVLRETLHLFHEDPGEPWWLDAVGDVAPADPSDLPGGYRHGLLYTVPLAEMPIHLPWLVDRFRAGGGRIVHRRLASLDELVGEAPVVVNCSGLGALSLAGDPLLEPIRGQVVRTTNPGLTRSVRDQDHPDGYTYIHPRSRDCVLGGTLEPGEWDTTPDHDVGESILERCRELVPALREAKVIKQAVGLRPGRPSVRLEREREPPAGVDVIHNYGHGGAGMTLSWGCAEAVADLVEAR